ncbi:MAG: hypothetical protein ACR2JF_16430 [Iamia sp.]
MKLRRLFGRDDASDDDLDEAAADASTDDGPEAAPERRAKAAVPEGGDAANADGSEDARQAEVGEDEAHSDAADSDDDSDSDSEADAAERDDAHDDDGDDGFREIEFELSDWGARERKLLDEILTGVRVRRVWQAGTLVVAANDAEIVDDLIDEIEDRMALDLPPGVDPVVYDVRDWPDGLEDRFIEVLIENRIAHRRGYQEITVGVDDEERVDELVEEVTTAWEDEQPTEDELDGPDASEVLSDLFVTSDRLQHDASDKTATIRFDDAASAVGDLSLPFGFAEGDWAAIKDAVQDLRDRLGDAEATDTDIEEAAASLRTLLRPLV